MWAGPQFIPDWIRICVCLWLGGRWTDRSVSSSPFSQRHLPRWSLTFCIYLHMNVIKRVFRYTKLAGLIRLIRPPQVWVITTRLRCLSESVVTWKGSKFSRWARTEIAAWPCLRMVTSLAGETRNTCNLPPSPKPHRYEGKRSVLFRSVVIMISVAPTYSNSAPTYIHSSVKRI